MDAVTYLLERSGSMVECLTQDRLTQDQGVVGASLTRGLRCVLEQDTLSSA